MTEKELCRECAIYFATGEHGLCEDCRLIRDDDFANIGMYVSDSGEVLDIEPKPDFESCWNCGGAFGFATSQDFDRYVCCPVCGNVLNTRSDDDEYDWSDWYPTDDELSEETQPIPPVSERAEVVDDALSEDERLARENYALEMLAADAENLRNEEIRDLEQVGLAWWLDMPIPFELTPLAEDFLRKLGR